MKPPHWLCSNCGIIIKGQSHEPSVCSYCGSNGFLDIGYEGEYDRIQIRAKYKILFRPERFTPESQDQYWKNLTPEEKRYHQAQINELNDNIQELIDHGDLDISIDELEKELTT
jgi:type II restriction/modification system DNA methylase subunit YeeA